MESVMYNPMVNQFERLIELGEGGKPTPMKFSISKVDMTQVIDNMEEVPLITEGERNSLPPFDALSSDVSINTWSRNQDADPKEKIREFFDRNIFWYLDVYLLNSELIHSIPALRLPAMTSPYWSATLFWRCQIQIPRQSRPSHKR